MRVAALRAQSNAVAPRRACRAAIEVPAYERSLEAMWHACRAARFAALNRIESDAGVVRALLQARYYDSSRGQFLSQDPVSLGDPRQQNLSDPQSLNSYSYSEDNPIVKSDPNGKCIEDACVGETIAAVSLIDLAVEYGPAIVGGIDGGLNTYLTHQTNPNTPAPGFAQYATGIGFGAASGYTLEGSAARILISGTLNAIGSGLQDQENGNAINPWNTGFSFVSPGLGYGLFGKLAGPSAIQELEAGVNGLSGFYGGNVVDIGVQQIRYEIASGVFSMSIDSLQRGVINSSVKQQSQSSSKPATQSSSAGGGGGYGSLSWSRLSEQLFRVDKWSVCRG